MKLSSLRHLALGLAFVTGASAAQAHELFLVPSSTVLSKADWITVDAAVSNDLFFNHQPLGLENLVVSAPDGSLLAPENALKGRLRSVFDLNLAQPGTYRIAVVNDGLFARWKDKATGQPRRARATPETLASQVPADAQELQVTQSVGRIETFATVGKPSTLRPSGRGLELLAAAPTDLVQGEPARFAMQIDGQPAPDLEVTLTRGGTRYRDQVEEIKLRTDAQGRFAVTWPQPGMYRLEAASTDGKTTTPLAAERRLSYAATLEVMP